jgi:hypothetical protein
MRTLIAWALLVGCTCGAETPSVPATVDLVSFEAQTLTTTGLTIGQTVGTDAESTSTITYTPQVLGGLFDPELDELRLEVRATTGARMLSSPGGTPFRARLPVSGRISARAGSSWELSARCDAEVSVPMPGTADDGTFRYADDVTLWQSCLVDLRRGPNLTYGIRVEIHGDGHVEANAMSGVVTVGAVH